MNILTFLLYAQEVVANEAAQVLDNPAAAEAADAAATTAQKGSGWSTIILLVGFIVIFYLLLYLPQKKQRKEQQKFLDSLQKGSKVVTAGGIYGTVTEVKDNSLLIEVDKGVQIRVAKSSVQKDFSPETAPVAQPEAKPEKK